MTLSGDATDAARTVRDGPQDELRLEQQRWRETILTVILWTAAGTAVLAVGFLAHQGFTRYGVLPFLVALVAVLGISLTRWLRFGLRAGMVLGAMYAACTLALIRFGPAPNAIVGLAFLVATSTLLLGRRTGIAAAALSVATLAGAPLLHRFGLVALDPGWPAMFDATDLETTLRLITVFGAGATVLVASITHLLGRTENLLLDKMRSLEELREAQAEREHIRGQLETRDEALRRARELELLGRLAGFAAHDFNNALFVIQGNAELARESSSDPDELHEAIAAIESAAANAAQTSHQLLAFGAQPTQAPKRLALDEQAERAGRMLKRILPSNISVHVSTEETPPVKVDEGMIQRVITSLALHARDGMIEGGRLDLSVRKARGEGSPRVLLEVADSGPGIDARALGQLPAADGALHSPGLGSVQELVAANGGRLEVDSQPGRGTRFCLSFPADAEPAPAATAPPDALSGCVLVVEDEPHVRRVMVRVLGRRGLTVLQSADALAAQEQIKGRPASISLLVTDCTLPGAPVRELVRTFRGHNPDGRVLACSGYAPESLDLQPGLFDGFLPKPFDAAALIESVGALIELGVQARGRPLAQAP